MWRMKINICLVYMMICISEGMVRIVVPGRCPSSGVVDVLATNGVGALPLLPRALIVEKN